jgi:hypothetical protein
VRQEFKVDEAVLQMVDRVTQIVKKLAEELKKREKP